MYHGEPEEEENYPTLLDMLVGLAALAVVVTVIWFLIWLIGQAAEWLR